MFGGLEEPNGPVGGSLSMRVLNQFHISSQLIVIEFLVAAVLRHSPAVVV